MAPPTDITARVLQDLKDRQEGHDVALEGNCRPLEENQGRRERDK